MSSQHVQPLRHLALIFGAHEIPAVSLRWAKVQLKVTRTNMDAGKSEWGNEF